MQIAVIECIVHSPACAGFSGEVDHGEGDLCESLQGCRYRCGGSRRNGVFRARIKREALCGCGALHGQSEELKLGLGSQAKQAFQTQVDD